MNLTGRIEAFIQLGTVINRILKGNGDQEGLPSSAAKLGRLVQTVQDHNPWFTAENVKSALSSIANSLTEKNLKEWTGRYPQLQKRTGSKRIGVIMAGNIPLVGFHDFLCVLISGHRFIGKLSSKDDRLLPEIANILGELQPGFRDKVEFAEGPLKNADAIIATGSDNTSRYFNYYFGEYPHIIRKNRNGVAILNGKESRKNLEDLGSDIFSYFGLGCRNVSKIYAPENYNFNPLLDAVKRYRNIIDHPKYYNNYIYNRSVFLVNGKPFHDGTFVLLTEDRGFTSPIGVIFYQYHSGLQSLKDEFRIHSEKIQCILGNNRPPAKLPFGSSRKPELWDYADGIDTIAFLLSLE